MYHRTSRKNQPTFKRTESTERPWYLWEDRDEDGELETKLVTYSRIVNEPLRISELDETPT